MKATSRYITLALLIVAALGSYSIGFMRGVMVFVILGIIFEAAFWVGVLQSKATNKEE